MDAAVRKSVEGGAKAKRLHSKASGVGSAGIASDDIEALAKLNTTLVHLEKAQSIMKAANKAIRVHKTQETRVTALIAEGLSDKQATELLKPDFGGRIGFVS